MRPHGARIFVARAAHEAAHGYGRTRVPIGPQSGRAADSQCHWSMRLRRVPDAAQHQV